MKLIAIMFISAAMMFGNVIGQYRLEYKASGTTPLHYKAHTDFEAVQTMMGQEQKVNMVSDQYLSVTSTGADSELIFSMTIDSGANVMMMPTGDTNRVPSPAIGKVRETRILSNGEQISSRWLDTTFANSQAGQQADQLGTFFFKLPTGSVDTGATWTQDKVDTVGIPNAQGRIIVNTNTNYKLVGKEDANGVSCAKIQFTGKITMKGSAAIQGMDFGIDGSGTVDGIALFDYGAGKVKNIAGSSDQDIVMATAGENAMTIPMSRKANFELSSSK